MYKHNNPLQIIARETSGRSYACHRYCFEHHEAPPTDLTDSSVKFEVLESGETQMQDQSTDMRPMSSRLISAKSTPIFRYFLDGSRLTYKVDDIQYGRRIFPIIAAQIGVVCCERKAKDKFGIIDQASTFQRILAVPGIADSNGPSQEFFDDLCNKINNSVEGLKGKIRIDQIVFYDDEKQDKEGLLYENIAIAMLHEHMLDLEKGAVNFLAKERRLLSSDRYLMKDGSLEYTRSNIGDFGDLSLIRNNFRFVVGVSKSFNPEHCVNKKGKPNASAIAELPVGHRTPAFKFRSFRSKGEGGSVYLVSWYLRLRDMKYTVSPFDGVLKVELILTGDAPYDELIESEEIDMISANLFLERLPACYGRDARWANHIYPISLAERYLKSKFMSDTLLMNVL